MQAVRLLPDDPLPRVEELPRPVPRGAQVLVRVAGCGVCRTDLHIARGVMTRVELPLVPGHEIAGWIEAAGDAAGPALREAGLAIGDPVLVFGGWGCGTCADCRAGEEQRCPTGRAAGFQENGGWAEAVLVPHPRHLVPLGSLDPRDAGPLADAGATTLRAVRRAAPWLGDGARVAVVGLGGLGQFAIQHLRRGRRLRVVGADPNPRRRAIAAELGADASVDVAEPSLLREALGGEADVVLDLVGSDATLEAAGAIVAPGGLVMLVGEAGGHATFGFRTQLESWWSTTAWASPADLREVVSLAATGELRWTTERLPLADAAAALDRLADGDVAGRIVLVPAGTS